MNWWDRIEARDREAAEAGSRYVEQMKALQRTRQERENRERVAAWEAQQAEQRAEIARAEEGNARIRNEAAERMAREAARRETAEREAAERAHEPPVGMPNGWRVPALRWPQSFPFNYVVGYRPRFEGTMRRREFITLVGGAAAGVAARGACAAAG
jgi:ATPase subunit of ABC transporter with duplicated ATPase domains